MRQFRPVVVAIIIAVFLVITPSATSAQEPVIPNFWDKHERFQRPELAALARLKFLTTTDFPPFNFIDRKKRLAGFHIDLARAICSELGVLPRCQIQAVLWDELVSSLQNKEGEAIIAGLAVNDEMRGKLEFSRPYMQIPARFIVRRDSELQAPAYQAIFKKVTGVVAGSSHERYFGDVFATRQSQAFETREAALAALQAGEISAVFTDALSASFWLQSEASQECCVFLDGAFISTELFGQGLTIAVSKERRELTEAINFALYQINENGKFAELYLRYFPLGLF